MDNYFKFWEDFFNTQEKIAKALNPYSEIYQKHIEIIQRVTEPYQQLNAQIEKLSSSFNSDAINALIKQTNAINEMIAPQINLAIKQFEFISKTITWDNYFKESNLMNEALSPYIEMIQATSQDFFNSYERLLESIPDIKLYPENASILLKYPTIDLTLHRLIIRDLLVDNFDTEDETLELSDEDNGIIEEVKKEIISIDNHLNIINPDLLNLWSGAKEAIQSNNPDKVRHAITSLRELFTSIIHTLAPNNEIKKWSDKKDHYHNGKPTRRARILYILKNYLNENLVEYIEKDVKSILSLFDCYQGGTHSIKSKYDSNDLNFILYRTESFLMYLFKLNDNKD